MIDGQPVLIDVFLLLEEELAVVAFLGIGVRIALVILSLSGR